MQLINQLNLKQESVLKWMEMHEYSNQIHNENV